MPELQYDPAIDYAVLAADEWRPGQPISPRRARWDPETASWMVQLDTHLGTGYELLGTVMVLGRWDDKVHPLAGAAMAGKTWGELADVRVEQERERIVLDGRLAAAGIRIDVPRGKQAGAVVLNYAELDRLLTLAGF